MRRACARAGRAPERRADPRSRRCASARSCTTSASRSRATCAPTAASPSWATTRSASGWCTTSAAGCARASASRASSARSRAITSCSASWSTSARSTARRCTATCAARRRWRSRSRCCPAPTGSPPAGRRADEATAAHLELARELMTAALDWREHGPPRVPIRGDELAGELGIEPGPELGRLLGELERPPTWAKRDTRSRRSRWRVGCARDRRFSRSTRTGGGATATSGCTRRWRPAAARLLHLDRPLRADRGGVRLDPQRVRPASARRGGRDPRPPAAQARGLRRHGLHRAQDRPLRRSRPR